MRKSELRKIVKEEYRSLLKENNPEGDKKVVRFVASLSKEWGLTYKEIADFIRDSLTRLKI